MDQIPFRALQATVIGDSDASQAELRVAEAVGALLASREVTLITGGRGGVMEAACRGAWQAGGLTVGILPGTDLDAANPWCRVVVPTGLGHARNLSTVLAGDLVIGLGGAAGTLSELCFSWIHHRPLVLFVGYGGWCDRIAAAPLDHRGGSELWCCRDLNELDRVLVGLITRLGRPLNDRR